MKDYKVGDIITIRKDLSENNINEIMSPIFGESDGWANYLRMLRERDVLGKSFIISEKRLWKKLGHKDGYAFMLNWPLAHYTAQGIFQVSFRQLMLFEDEV